MRENYEDLGNAVVLQAVRDWRTAVRRLKRYPGSKYYQALRDETEEFFLSAWFGVFTNLDGFYLLEMLEKEEGIV